MVVIILAITLSVLDGTIVNLALPGMARDLNASAAHSVWIVNAYQLATLVMLLPFSTLGDLVGYRRVFLAGVVTFTVASAACILATSLPWLTAARAVQGIGAAAIMAVNPALVRLTYPRHLLGRGIALNSVVVATGSVAGPTVAAAVLSVASWPWLFAINVPLGIAIVVLGLRALPANHALQRGKLRLSWLDVVLNGLMFSLVFLGVDMLGTQVGVKEGTGAGARAASHLPGPLDAIAGGHATAFSVALIAAGVLTGVFYIRRQLSQPVPFFPVDLLRIPLFRLSICTSVTAFAAQMLSMIALPFLLLDGYGKSHLQTGLLITAWPLAIVATAPLAGRLIGRVHAGALGGLGLGLLAAGLALLAALPAQPSNMDIVWRMVLCGIGFGLFQSPNNHTIITSAPLHRSGGASGMLATARLTGQTIGAVLLAIIFSYAGAHDGRGPAIALGLAAAFAGAAAVFSSLRVRH
ncbi:MAG: MFS transporter [Comamonadaceae bacterium]|nr:MAG: MFS transporter [Comamonadaceae bacterium]